MSGVPTSDLEHERGYLFLDLRFWSLCAEIRCHVVMRELRFSYILRRGKHRDRRRVRMVVSWLLHGPAGSLTSRARMEFLSRRRGGRLLVKTAREGPPPWA